MHTSPTPEPLARTPHAASRISWEKRYLLAAFVLLSSFSVYLLLCIPDHAPSGSALRWRASSEAAAAMLRVAVVVAALVSLRMSSRKKALASPREFYPAYFTLTAFGIALSLLIVLSHAKGDPIDTSASLLQAAAWLMTSVLSLVAARNNRSELATQWLVRSAVVASTCLIQALLMLIPVHAALGSDKIGLERGILVFAAFLGADVALSWRYVTVNARGRKSVAQ